MNRQIGRFYLKLTDSKNLIGEFSNSDCQGNYTESADLDPQQPKPDDGKFSGHYFSTWHEDHNGHECVLAKLKITRKHPDIFSLEWTEINNNSVLFKGEGMLCDGILIGDYRPGP
jgi:hypothetical protein